MIEINKNIAGILPSGTMVFSAKAKALKESGKRILDFTAGEPDFDTPLSVCEEAVHSIRDGFTRYTSGSGIVQLRTSICEKLRRDNGIEVSEDGVIVTPGGKDALWLSLYTVLNVGDEVIIPDPSWVSYDAMVRSCGAIPVHVMFSAPDFTFDVAVLERAVTSKTKALVINFPNNPTGAVMGRTQVEELVLFMKRHRNIVLVSDEIYEKLVYDGAVNYSPAAFSEIADRVITVNGFSKSCAMTGWRLGYLACNTDIAKYIYRIFQHTITCTNSFVQRAGVEALACISETEKMRLSYQKRRDMFITGLNSVYGVSANLPHGAFYAWVKFNIPTITSSADLCNFLLEQAGIAGVPGSAFCKTDEPYVRFCFAAPERELSEAVSKLRFLLGSCSSL